MRTESDFGWQRRAGDSIAQGALTNSKRPEIFVKGVYPTHATGGLGARLTGIDGKSYIDYICGLGSNLFGYGNLEIWGAISKAYMGGTTLSLSSTIEVEFAERLKGYFPFIDLLKILKTGSEATHAAVKIARAHTGRLELLSDGYHSWFSEFTSLTPPAYGCENHANIKKFTSLEQITTNTAAVIVEPIIVDYSDERLAFLRALREKCTETGTVLIFDEVITGCRYLKHSVSKAYGIDPDIICLGKALGGGMPIGIVGGKKEIMSSKEYFVSSTFAGDRLAIAGGMAALKMLASAEYKIENLWDDGARFIKGFNALAFGVQLKGYPTRGVFEGEPMAKALFFQEACKAGFLFGPSWFFNFKHYEYTEMVLNGLADIFNRIKTGSVKLEGEMPTTPFAQKIREVK